MEEVRAPGQAGAEPGPEMQELRRLLLGPEQRELAELRRLLLDPRLRAQALSEILPLSIALRGAPDPALSGALGPLVEELLKGAVRRDPGSFASAIYPVMGPAIRKAITESIRELLQRVNSALEHSLSLRGLSWRLRAWRTGSSFGEVVLEQTLTYRVEQVFLIYRESGLALLHLTAPEVRSQDPDMISGMLTAIQDFVRDSFRVTDGGTLETMSVGDLQVWVEQGPLAVLAVAVRGTAPESLRRRMQVALEDLHVSFARELQAFGGSGDAAALLPARALLEPCLQRQAPRARSPVRAWIALCALVLLLLGWAASAARDARRFARYVAHLRAQPGVVLTYAAREGGSYRVEGLLDPLAADPAAAAAAFGVPRERLLPRFRPYYALEPDMVQRRARAVLSPPPGVRLALSQGVVHLAGEAQSAWLAQARRRAAAIPGVIELRHDHLVLRDQVERERALRVLAGEVEDLGQTQLRFITSTAELVPGQDEVFKAQAAAIARLIERAARLERRLTVVVRGHADPRGVAADNVQLSRRRAEAVVSALRRVGAPAAHLEQEAVGASMAQPGESGQALAASRRVTFHPILRPISGPGEERVE